MTAAPVAFPGWKPQQAHKAATSLLKWVGEQQAKANALIEDDELVYLLVALKKSPQAQRKDKPVRIPIPHPLMTVEGVDICLFVKDLKGDGSKAAKKRLAKFTKSGGVAKIVGTSKLRTKYESHEAKRQLCSLYDIFLADERVLPSLPKLIGKSFFKKKKQPIPVDIMAKNWPEQVKRAVEATYMQPPSGSCITVRVGRSSMSVEQVAANVAAALAGVVERVPKKWSNVQAVYLKTAESVALPLYQAVPDQPLRIEGEPAADDEAGSQAPPAPAAAPKATSRKATAPKAAARKAALSKAPAAAATGTGKQRIGKPASGKQER